MIYYSQLSTMLHVVIKFLPQIILYTHVALEEAFDMSQQKLHLMYQDL